MTPLREVCGLVLKEADSFVRARLAVALGLITLAAVLTGLGPAALKIVVDRLSGAASGRWGSMALWMGFYVVTQFLGRCISELRGLIYARAERRMSRTLSERLFAHILQLPLRYHWDRETGGLIQGISNGVQGYQLILRTLVFSVLPILAELATIVAVLGKLDQPLFLVLFCGAITCYAIAFTFAARWTRKAGRNASAAQVDATGTMTDGILSYETIKYFTAESEVERRVQAALMRSENEWVKFTRQYAVNGLLIATIYGCFLGTTMLYAASETSGGQLSIGTFVLINTYMLQIVRPVESFGVAMQNLSQGLAYLDKALQVLHEKTESEVLQWGDTGRTEQLTTGSPEPKIVGDDAQVAGDSGESLIGMAGELVQGPVIRFRTVEHSNSRHRTVAAPLMSNQKPADGDPTRNWSPASVRGEAVDRSAVNEETRPLRRSRKVTEAEEGRGEVEFREVCLSYRPGLRVLEGVSFRVPPGRTLGIVGASGSGKSTLVRLLTRMLEPDGGTILLDGAPVRAHALKALRGAIGVVPQVTDLFNDTIGYNIGFGREGSSQAEIEAAAKLAHLHEFILSRPEGYRTRVGEQGVKLSGGQRQRISIARAVIKRPRVYVFDEATSSLDTTTEREILMDLEGISRHCTSLVIAHRLSTVMHMDEILVLDEGAVVEQGTHEKLLAMGGHYAALWQAQYRGDMGCRYQSVPPR